MSNTAATHSNTPETRKERDLNSVEAVKDVRRADLSEALVLAQASTEAASSAAVGRAGLGEHLYPNNANNYQQTEVPGVSEEAKIAMARVSQTDGFESVEDLRTEQPVTQNDYVRAVTEGTEKLKSQIPTAQLNTDDKRAVVAATYEGAGIDQAEAFANDPAHATGQDLRKVPQPAEGANTDEKRAAVAAVFADAEALDSTMSALVSDPVGVTKELIS